MNGRAWLLILGVAVVLSVLVGLWYARLPAERELDKAPTASTGAELRAQPFRLAPQPRADSERAPLPSAASAIRLEDVTERSGITFKHQDGSSGRHFTPETMSAGVATFDYDSDGLIDIYFPNGAALPGVTYDPPPRHALYKNWGDWQFQDVSEQAGLVCTVFGLGIAVADYDNDGFPDIYLNNFGPNILYRNNGDGTFTDATGRGEVAGITPSGELEKKVGAGACFLDLRGDGCLDLFSGNYIEIELETYVTPMKGNYGFYPTPMAYAPVPSTLYQNLGDGAFADISEAAGLLDCQGRCMGAIACDYDHDGDADLFVCNDVMENFLLRNDQGRFSQVGFVAGVAMSPNAEMVANMAVDAADYNNDGWLDFFTTNYDRQYPLLLRNLHDGIFSNETLAANAGRSIFGLVKWGCGFVDFDNDGHQDIYIANGHTDDNVGFVEPGATYHCPDVVLWNTGQERFVDVSEACGIRELPPQASRGVAFDDLDNDGDVDVVVFNSRQRPTLLRNLQQEQACRNGWLQIRLRGVQANRDGVGAHVRVAAGDVTLVREVHSGRGYQSHWGTRLHFGLGPQSGGARIEVRWLGGGTQVLDDVPLNQWLTIIEEIR